MLRRWIFNLFFVFAAVALGISLSLQPWRVYRQQQRVAELKEAEMQAAERRHVEELRLEARYGNRLGREELARNRGFQRSSGQGIEPEARSTLLRALRPS